MSTVYRPEDVPPRDRLEYWFQVLDNSMVRTDHHGDHAEGWGGKMVTGELGGLQVSRADGWRVTCEGRRTRRHIGDADAESLILFGPTSGRMVIEQDGRSADLRRGGLALVDASRPFRYLLRTWSTSTATAIRIPRNHLPMTDQAVAQLTATPLECVGGVGRLVASLVPEMVDTLDRPPKTHRIHLSNALLDLLTAAIGQRLDLNEPVSPRTMLQQVLGFIEDNLGDARLAPATIANAHFISVRHLHNLFEDQETTVAAWIRHRRLERCRRELLAPGHEHRSVSAIAAGWGFTHPTHFSRIFRAAYGVPPGEYRILNTGEKVGAEG